MTQYPHGWSSAPLHEICAINPRVDKNSIDAERSVSFVPMPAVEAETGKIDVRKTRPFREVRKGYTPFRKGDILFAKITPCMENGKMGIVPDLVSEYGFGSTEFHVLRPCEGIDARFLYHAVSNRAFRHLAEHSMTGAVGQKRVPATVLEQHEIWLPPTNEQRRIADRIETIFNEIDRGVDSLRDAKRAIDLYRQSLLKSAFEGRLTADWRAANANELENSEVLLARVREQQQDSNDAAPCDYGGVPGDWLSLSLSSLGQVTGGLTKNQKRSDLPLKAKYLRVANVYSNRLELDEIKEIGVTRDELRKTRLEEGDLLFVEGNGSIAQIGRVAVWNDSIPNMTYQNHLIRFRANGLLTPRFALYFMMSPVGRRRITAQASSTSGLHTLGISKVEALPVPLCSSAEQAEVVRTLDARLQTAEFLDKEINANLARADALRQSILKKALSGELVPQNPDDEPAQALLARIRASRSRHPSSKPQRSARRRARAAPPS